VGSFLFCLPLAVAVVMAVGGEGGAAEGCTRICIKIPSN
jgi:hypothetical protein